jgi:Delta3-Delta2-enoyl-CoA isomerase
MRYLPGVCQALDSWRVKTLTLERRSGVAIVRIEKARGNAIDDDLVADLGEAAEEAARDDGVGGIVLSSGHARLFSPGLDLVALSSLGRGDLGAFMRRFLSMVRCLYGLPKPMVAAVSGHAVAGGCILALTADWRVLARDAVIGLNEVKIGLPLPWSIALLVRGSVSPAASVKVALLGRNFSNEEALACGLADELADPGGVDDAALARLAEFTSKERRAMAITKACMRSATLGEMTAHEEEGIPDFLDAWFSPGTQERLRGLLASLGRSSS